MLEGGRKEVGWWEKGSEKESDPGHLPVLEGGQKEVANTEISEEPEVP